MTFVLPKKVVLIYDKSVETLTPDLCLFVKYIKHSTPVRFIRYVKSNEAATIAEFQVIEDKKPVEEMWANGNYVELVKTHKRTTKSITIGEILNVIKEVPESDKIISDKTVVK